MKYKQIAFRPNTLCYGDCLDILKKWVEQEHKVDLIYLDPPFNSKRNYNMIFGKDSDQNSFDERAQFVAFEDTWYWSSTARQRVNELSGSVYNNLGNAIQGLELILGESDMLAYVSYMAERLIWMHQILKDSGSIYLHCDPTASHYLKVILDCIFGEENFRQEVIWYRYNKIDDKRKIWCKYHDTIFCYSASKTMKWNPLTIATGKTITRKKIKKIDGKITNIDETITYQQQKCLTRSVIDNIPDIAMGNSKEKLSYPTQKPIALLERLIKTSTNKGDLVLDPFCGCGTAGEAAWKLKRDFIGVDVSPYAITEVCQRRLKNAEGVSIQGLPVDMQSAQDLGETDHFAFEQWAVSCLPGFMPNEKQGGDGGVDGRGVLLSADPLDQNDKKLARWCIAQVKVSKPSTDAIRALLSQVNGGKAAIGVFITLKKRKQTPSMQKAIGDAGTLHFKNGTKQYPRMVFWSIEEYFAGLQPEMPERGHPITGKRITQVEIKNV